MPDPNETQDDREAPETEDNDSDVEFSEPGDMDGNPIDTETGEDLEE